MNYTKSTVQQNFDNEMGVVNPSQLSHSTTVIPTCDVRQRYSDVIKFASSTTTASVVMIALDPKRDFYITGAFISIQKDAANDGTYFSISCNIDGATGVILSIASLTTTAQYRDQTISFPFPFKVDRGTQINMTGVFTAGTCIKRAMVMGFYA